MPTACRIQLWMSHVRWGIFLTQPSFLCFFLFRVTLLGRCCFRFHLAARHPARRVDAVAPWRHREGIPVGRGATPMVTREIVRHTRGVHAWHPRRARSAALKGREREGERNTLFIIFSYITKPPSPLLFESGEAEMFLHRRLRCILSASAEWYLEEGFRGANAKCLVLIVF